MVNCTQYDGRTLSLPQKPTRIVSLVPSITESLILMGCVPVGRSSFCVEPSSIVESIERMGGTKTPNINRIMAKDPDLVIVNKEENRKQDVQALIEKGISVWVTYPETVQDSYQMLRELSQFSTDQKKIDDMLIKYQTYLDTQYPQTGKKTLVMIWKKPWMVVGTQTYTNDLIAFSGGANACTQPRYPECSVSEIKEMQPEVVLLPNEPYRFEKEDVDFWQRLLPEALVEIVSGEDLFWSGHRAISASQTLSRTFTQSS